MSSCWRGVALGPWFRTSSQGKNKKLIRKLIKCYFKEDNSIKIKESTAFNTPRMGIV